MWHKRSMLDAQVQFIWGEMRITKTQVFSGLLLEGEEEASSKTH